MKVLFKQDCDSRAPGARNDLDVTTFTVGGSIMEATLSHLLENSNIAPESEANQFGKNNDLKSSYIFADN